ncbi:hypothetical protein [Argonema galeatum]|uniref:hypothetical protein n=1 Tax=Argonema galeatum TaxID=2942762 RepID=UPI002013ADE2|nr:hypothetical protein [Argonema galeatum]MCL1466030.1 hypothetical protein [Argonema galeatum A003/A1]
MSYINYESNRGTVETKARSLMLNHQRTIKNRQQSLLSRSGAEVGLPNVTE